MKDIPSFSGQFVTAKCGTAQCQTTSDLRSQGAIASLSTLSYRSRNAPYVARFLSDRQTHVLTPFSAANGAPKPAAQAASPKKRGRPRKNPSKTPNGMSRSVSVSDTSDSELEVEEPDEPSPLPPVRPEDPEGAVQYDTIKAIWSPRNKYPSVDKIKSALVAFKDVVKSVRDEWKSLSQAMKDAENQNNYEKASELRNKVVQQRKLINTVIITTIDKGHPVIIEKYVISLPRRLTLLARDPFCIVKIPVPDAYILRVIISNWIVSELKKIVNCQRRHGSSTDPTQMCAVSSLLPEFADKALRLLCLGNVIPLLSYQVQCDNRLLAPSLLLITSTEVFGSNRRS